MTGRFAGRSVIVTGGGRGMGKTIAASFAAEGAKVMIAARTMSYGEETLAELRAQGAEVALCQTDVTQADDIARLVEETAKAFGGIDVIVHNAAEVPVGAVIDIADDEVMKGYTSGVLAGFRFARAAVPYLRKSPGGGRMIFLSSICGPRTAMTGLAGYGASKAGLNAFVEHAALELGPDGITVNVVEPGVTDTDRMRASLTDDMAAKIASVVPMRRIGHPDGIAHAVMFLADPQAGYITGRAITVDGGLSLSATNLGGFNEG